MTSDKRTILNSTACWLQQSVVWEAMGILLQSMQMLLIISMAVLCILACWSWQESDLEALHSCPLCKLYQPASARLSMCVRP